MRSQLAAVTVVAGVLAALTSYELAVALGAIDLGTVPGGGPPGEGVVRVAALVTGFAAIFLAMTLARAPRPPATAALLAPLAAAFLVAHFYTFDPYYLPTLRRLSENQFIPPAVVFALAAAAIAAGLLTLVRRRAGLALSAPVVLVCELTAWFAVGGH